MNDLDERIDNIIEILEGAKRESMTDPIMLCLESARSEINELLNEGFGDE